MGWGTQVSLYIQGLIRSAGGKNLQRIFSAHAAWQLADCLITLHSFLLLDLLCFLAKQSHLFWPAVCMPAAWQQRKHDSPVPAVRQAS